MGRFDAKTTPFKILVGALASVVLCPLSGPYSMAQQESELITTPAATPTPTRTPDSTRTPTATPTATPTPTPPQATLSVLASPKSYGVPFGSGMYPEGAVVTAGINPNYGYEFTHWQDTGGNRNPRKYWLRKDTTLVGLLKRRLFAVTLTIQASANQGGSASAYANVFNASTGRGIGSFSSSVTSVGPQVVSSKTHTIWVPYGDTVYFNGYGKAYSVHMRVAWTGGNSEMNNYDQVGWYNESYNRLSQVRVLGDTDLGYFRVGTPLLIDLSGEGQPDLLAGAQWRKTKERRPSGNPNTYRLFDLDGTGGKRWEWIGKNDGLLVYTADLNGTPTHKELFGTRTFGKTWKHGYEALATLDRDGDRVLKGDELTYVGVWIDSSSDAVAQSGEIRSAKDAGVSEISVAFEADADGNVWSARGAKLGGRDVAVWDWISYTFPETDSNNEIARLDWTNAAPPPEYLNVKVEKGMEAIEMLPGGTLHIYRINGQLYVRATAKVKEEGDEVLDVLYAAEITSDGVLYWGVDGLTNTLLASGSDFYGLTLEGKHRYALWSAKLVSGNMAALTNSR